MPEAQLTDPGALLATTHEAGELRAAAPGAARRRARRARVPRGGLPGGDGTERPGAHVHLRRPPQAPRGGRLGRDRRAQPSGRAGRRSLHRHGGRQLGVVVDERSRNRGVGKLLTEAVASLAIQQGATHLRGELPASDGPVVRPMERLGRTVRTVEDGTEVVYTELPRPGAGRHDHGAGRRAARVLQPDRRRARWRGAPSPTSGSRPLSTTWPPYSLLGAAAARGPRPPAARRR